jgi:RNA polymerase sigma-70 factor (ECF subfamily)
MTDESTILLAKEGRPEAFRALYDRNREIVYRLAFRYVRSRQDAEDVMQETFIKAFKGIRRFDFKVGSSFAAWLGTICVHCAIEHLRRTQRRSGESQMSLSDLPQEPASADPSPERTAIARRSLSDVERAYGRLSPGQQVIFDLRHRQHLDIKEIAARMDCSESNVKTQLGRSVAKLRKFLEPLWGEL